MQIAMSLSVTKRRGGKAGTYGWRKIMYSTELDNGSGAVAR